MYITCALSIIQFCSSCRWRSISSLSLCKSMLKCVLVVNSQGKPRLMRYYNANLSHEREQVVSQQLYNLVSRRQSKHTCCIVRDEALFGPGHSIIYRHFATLYFIFVADSAESELGILDMIHVFVQVLDSCFTDVCELDLIYHFDKVNYILDEIVMGGTVIETNVDTILEHVGAVNKLVQSEQSFFG
eukprot:GHVS01091300.1.p1 GENE.GHVS01091300.1~~GHVS01091300.1.p1  ORF type:complete len:187 (+),score=13.96 GHVS01091300.1:3-563(+)